MPEAPKPLGDEVVQFSASVDDEVALGDPGIRKKFARNTMVLFAISNVCVLIGLGVVVGLDASQLAGGIITAEQRIVDHRVIMALLGATTVQLGTVIFTIARAIFPAGTAQTQ